MTFFGVDPGTAATGYGVVRIEGNTVRWVDSGVISTLRAAQLDEKLECIFDGLCGKIALHGPDTVCVEEAFYGKNARTALVLGLARGVSLLAARKCNARVVEFSPREIKKAVVGNGGATKQQVAFMVQTLLGPSTRHATLDASDALAAALCAYYHHSSRAMTARG